ncbi:hypothetical protein Tco_0027224 [Tanacetum coccineum]
MKRSISRIKSSSRHEVTIPNPVFRCSEIWGEKDDNFHKMSNGLSKFEMSTYTFKDIVPSGVKSYFRLTQIANMSSVRILLVFNNDLVFKLGLGQVTDMSKMDKNEANGQIRARDWKSVKKQSRKHIHI